MSDTNRFGLSRDMPEEVKRIVRQRCGFGCVICAGAIVEYDHVIPEFARARRHDPAGIALLCPTCHNKKTRNFLSRRRVVDAMREPAAKKAGFAFSELESTHHHPYVVFAGMTLQNCQTPVEIRGLPVLQVEAAELTPGPYRLSASFFDSKGVPSLFIRKNEWQVLANSWDIEAKGGLITVRMAPSDVALRLRLDPGRGVVVEKLAMFCAGYRLEGDADGFVVTQPNGKKISFKGGLIDNCRVGLSLN